MRVLFMGQTGIDKKRHIETLIGLCKERGVTIDRVFHIGDIMYEESEKTVGRLAEGKILDLPLNQLAVLRRLAFSRIAYETVDMKSVFVNSHAVFRWNNRLFRAYEITEIDTFGPDMIITLIDNVEAVKANLEHMKEQGILPKDARYTLKDLMVWREEEILASEVLADVLKIPHYILGVSLDPQISKTPIETACELVIQPGKRKAYVSYPISEARHVPELWEKVCRFRRTVRSYLTTFDPLMVSEKRLQGILEANPNAPTIRCPLLNGEIELEATDVAAIIPDIDGQIEARDYQLIDQADMIVAYFPEDDKGAPVIAGGVQSEIEHAHSATKDIVIVWEASRHPTPFIGLKVDRQFETLEQLEEFLKEVSKPTGQLQMQFGANCQHPD